ncbi:hypothetical protein LVD15_25865 [Fulvivirga maritima]|uniref:hypothetical protein n=1 Tax=Fulvivirga maritima TaxID=2904247 RepID=UPI001F310299|nr:hypothetical protein [Fulvivirga maritima]UII26682.1 hypothetical protein LVD15_25865 [Fulvivirga maritima]
MARASSDLIVAIKNTASKLEQSAIYQWGHMGSCNCGFLAQELTRLSKSEIHSRAMQKYGDWNEQLNDYCPTSGLLMDDLISEMLHYGLDTDDLKHLEKLSSPKVLNYLPKGTYLKHNVKQDVIMYLRAWANQLEDELLSRIKISELNQRPIEQNV